MGNTINVGGMNSYVNSIVQSRTRARRTDKTWQGDSVSSTESKTNFTSAMEKRVDSLSVSDVAGTGRTGAISTKDMTLEEYKQYINDRITGITIHPSKLCDYHSISISEAGFKAMQDDPEYEKWVLDELTGMLSTPFPSGSRMLTGTICGVTSFGATKKECRSVSWSAGYHNGNGKKIWEEKSEGSFWARRGKQKKVQEQADKKAAAKRELEKEWQQEAIEKRRAYTDFLNREAMLQTNNIRGHALIGR